MSCRIVPRVVLMAMFPLVLAGCPEVANVESIGGLVYARGYVAENPDAPRDEHTYVLKDLLMDVLIPTDGPAADRPAFLVMHGGAFTGGSRGRNDLVRYARRVASAGYVCFLIDYRLEGEAPPAPEQWNGVPLTATIHAAAVDARAALRYIRANAETYGVDPDRIAAGGASAGSVTAFNIAMYGSDTFQDDGPGFSVPPENNPGLDVSVAAVVDLWGGGSLAIGAFDANDPPVMMVHGTLDFTAGVSFPESLVTLDALNDAGIPVVYHLLPGEGHSAWDAKVDGKDLAELTLDFLELYLP